MDRWEEVVTGCLRQASDPYVIPPIAVLLVLYLVEGHPVCNMEAAGGCLKVSDGCRVAVQAQFRFL